MDYLEAGFHHLLDTGDRLFVGQSVDQLADQVVQLCLVFKDRKITYFNSLA